MQMPGGGDVTLEIAVNNTVFYSGTFGKDDSSGMAGQEFVITYKVPSASDKVTAKLYCSNDLGQWGGCVTSASGSNDKRDRRAFLFRKQKIHKSYSGHILRGISESYRGRSC